VVNSSDFLQESSRFPTQKWWYFKFPTSTVLISFFSCCIYSSLPTIIIHNNNHNADASAAVSSPSTGSDVPGAVTEDLPEEVVVLEPEEQPLQNYHAVGSLNTNLSNEVLCSL
jgi:hypothetical protein